MVGVKLEARQGRQSAARQQLVEMIHGGGGYTVHYVNGAVDKLVPALAEAREKPDARRERKATKDKIEDHISWERGGVGRSDGRSGCGAFISRAAGRGGRHNTGAQREESSALTFALTIRRSAAPPPHAMRLRSLLASVLSLTAFGFLVVGVSVRPRLTQDRLLITIADCRGHRVCTTVGSRVTLLRSGISPRTMDSLALRIRTAHHQRP